MHIVIRADGGPSIGYGHLVRTGALAEYVLNEEHRVTYATHTPRQVREVCADEVEVQPLDTETEQEEFLQWLSEVKPEIAIVDAYDIDGAYQRSISSCVSRFGVILDDTRFEICADVLINGNVYAHDLEYDWVGEEPEWCLGIEYLLLRKEIRELAADEPSFKKTPQQAVITMGGSDVNGTTPDVIRAFGGTELSVDVIVGPGFENRAAISQAVAETDGAFDVVQDPDDLPQRMFDADLAVSATGSTIYELLALGTPTIGIPQVDNQLPIAEALVKRNAVLLLGGAVTENLPNTIRKLSADTELRRQLRMRGRDLVDGYGVDRVYETLVAEFS